MDSTHRHESDRNPAGDLERLPLAVLVARAQSRVPAAWGEIVYRLGPLVLTWAQQFGLKPEDAEDTAPEVFLAVFEHLEWFDGKLPEWNFYAWVRRITKNKVRQRLGTRRRRRVEPEALGGSLAQALLAEAPQPAPADGGEADHCESDQRARQIEAVRRARAGVEPKTWLAFVGHAVDERLAADVGAELKMTKGAVYQSKYCVIRSARRHLDALDR